MKTILKAMLILTVFALPATAQLDPDPDGMGIYFDTDGLTNCIDYDPAQGATSFTAYLLLTNASAEQPTLLAWEAEHTVYTNAFLGGGYWQWENPGIWPYCCCGDIQSCLVYVDEPFEYPAMMLAYHTLTFIGIAVDPYAVYSINRVLGSLSFAESPGYSASDGTDVVLIPGNHIFGTWGEPSAWINHPDGPCSEIQVISSDTMTWSAVKTMYEN